MTKYSQSPNREDIVAFQNPFKSSSSQIREYFVGISRKSSSEDFMRSFEYQNIPNLQIGKISETQQTFVFFKKLTTFVHKVSDAHSNDENDRTSKSSWM